MQISINIPGGTSSFFDPSRINLFERASAQNVEPTVFTPKNHTAVKFTLSKEARESYRKTIQSQTGGIGTDLKAELGLLADAKVTETGGDYRFERLLSLNAGLNGAYSPSDLLDNYTKLYDEIVRGYQSGERERFELTDDGYRKVTMEEELELLDRSFEKSLTWMEELEERNVKIRSFIIEYAHELEKRGNGHLNFVANARKLEKEPVLPENFGQSVRTAAKEFVSQYTRSVAQKGSVNVEKLLESVKQNHMDFLKKDKT